MEALNAAKLAGASYADARIGRYRDNQIFTREQQIVNVVDQDSMGCGVRALVDGTWGFSATRNADEGRRRRGGAGSGGDREGESRRARQGGPARARAVVPGRDRGQTPHTIDPFTVPSRTRRAAPQGERRGDEGCRA